MVPDTLIALPAAVLHFEPAFRFFRAARDCRIPMCFPRLIDDFSVEGEYHDARHVMVIEA
jgi:hypothetical protein